MRRRDTNFYYSFLVLPPEKRDAIVAVWDLCRAIDDAADEAPVGLEQARRSIAAWRREVAALFKEGEPATPEGRALLPYVARFGLPRQSFDAVVDGVEMDLDCSRYPTFDALREYCVRVASAVGLIALEIFGYRDEGARAYAVELGLALQLTNIIRDVAADLRKGRIYLPQVDLERFGVSEQDLATGARSPEVVSLLRFECERAREYYGRARRCLPRVDRRRLVAARIMGAIYFELLRRIERRGYDVFSGKTTLPRRVKLWIAARTWTAAMAGM